MFGAWFIPQFGSLRPQKHLLVIAAIPPWVNPILKSRGWNEHMNGTKLVNSPFCETEGCLSCSKATRVHSLIPEPREKSHSPLLWPHKIHSFIHSYSITGSIAKYVTLKSKSTFMSTQRPKKPQSCVFRRCQKNIALSSRSCCFKMKRQEYNMEVFFMRRAHA